MSRRGPASDLIADEIRRRGPLTVARFMELALYAPGVGYYSSSSQRSGRAGDFYTSVDVGPLFGALLARLVTRAWDAHDRPSRFDLVEHAAGNGRLMRDILDALQAHAPACLAALRVSLVERSPDACAAQPEVLGPHASRLAHGGLPAPQVGVGLVIANELLDALPCHRVVSTPRGLTEVYVNGDADGLSLVEGPLSTPALAAYFEKTGCRPGIGGIADVSLDAVAWCRELAGSLGRGYAVIIDYGRAASRLYGDRLPGSLRSYERHQVDTRRPLAVQAHPAWLDNPGGRDITADVDWTAIERTLDASGLMPLRLQDQASFLASLDLATVLGDVSDSSAATVRRRLAASALLAPGGLGTAHQVLLAATPDAPSLSRLFANEPGRRRPHGDNPV